MSPVMGSTLAGAVINVILDPIVIFVFRWSMMGAAVAAINNMIRKYGAMDDMFGQEQYVLLLQVWLRGAKQMLLYSS
ncbi:MAG: hypothetical protein K6E34_06165 [Lachnospiraceae bacterium]|nr:hypothetical protein [Lachnospiraceae bacterium]